MKKLLLILLIISVNAHAQQLLNQRSYGASTGSANAVTLTTAGSDKFLLAGYLSFGYDSSYANYFIVDANTNIISHHEWRVSNSLNFMNDGAMLSNGNIMLCGIAPQSFGSDHPYLAVTDTAGNIVWSKWFDNLSYTQSEFIKIFPYQNDSFSLYSYGVTTTRGFYRIDGDNAGNNFRAMAVTCDSLTMSYRIYNGTATSSANDHIMAGLGFHISNLNTQNGFLVRVKPGGADWAKQFVFGGDGEFWDVIKSPDNNYLSIGYVADSVQRTNSMLMKTDIDGNVLWARKVKLASASLYLYSAAYTGDGKIIAVGLDINGGTVLVKLDESGNLLYAKRWVDGTIGGAKFINILHNTTDNIMKIAGNAGSSFIISNLDADGLGCNLVDIPGTRVINYTPTVIAVPVSTTFENLTNQTETLHERNANYVTADLCIDNGIAELDEDNTVNIYPNPASDFLNISLPNSSLVTIYNMLGQQVYHQRVLSSPIIDVSSFQNGVYLLRTQTAGDMTEKKFVVEH